MGSGGGRCKDAAPSPSSPKGRSGCPRNFATSPIHMHHSWPYHVTPMLPGRTGVCVFEESDAAASPRPPLSPQEAPLPGLGGRWTEEGLVREGGGLEEEKEESGNDVLNRAPEVTYKQSVPRRARAAELPGLEPAPRLGAPPTFPTLQQGGRRFLGTDSRPKC